MLNQITEVNNFLSHNYRPAKFNPIRDLKQYMLCEGHDHTFYRTRTDLLTNKVIQNVVHFVSKHTTPAHLLPGEVIEISKGRGRNFLVDVVFYQSVPLLSTRDVGIAFFKEEIRRVRSGKDLQFIHVERGTHFQSWETLSGNDDLFTAFSDFLATGDHGALPDRIELALPEFTIPTVLPAQIITREDP